MRKKWLNRCWLKVEKNEWDEKMMVLCWRSDKYEWGSVGGHLSRVVQNEKILSQTGESAVVKTTELRNIFERLQIKQPWRANSNEIERMLASG